MLRSTKFTDAISQKGAKNVEEKVIYTGSAKLTLNVRFVKGKRASIFGMPQAAADAQYLRKPCAVDALKK